MKRHHPVNLTFVESFVKRKREEKKRILEMETFEDVTDIEDAEDYIDSEKAFDIAVEVSSQPPQQFISIRFKVEDFCLTWSYFPYI